MSNVKNKTQSYIMVNEVEPTGNGGDHDKYEAALDMAVRRNQMCSLVSSDAVNSLYKRHTSSTNIKTVVLLEENASTAQSDVRCLVEGHTFLSESNVKVQEGLASLNEGVVKVLEGLAKLIKGVAKVLEGLATLIKGVAKVIEGLPSLIEGEVKVLEVQTELNETVAKVLEEHIPLNESVDQDLDGQVLLDESVNQVPERQSTFDEKLDQVLEIKTLSVSVGQDPEEQSLFTESTDKVPLKGQTTKKDNLPSERFDPLSLKEVILEKTRTLNVMERDLPQAQVCVQVPIERIVSQEESTISELIKEEVPRAESRVQDPDPIEGQAPQAESFAEFLYEGAPLETSNLQVALDQRYLFTRHVQEMPETNDIHSQKVTDDAIWYNGYWFRTIYPPTDTGRSAFMGRGHSPKVTDIVSHSGKFPMTHLDFPINQPRFPITQPGFSINHPGFPITQPNFRMTHPNNLGKIRNFKSHYRFPSRFHNSVLKSSVDSESNNEHSSKALDNTVLPAEHSPNNQSSPKDSRASNKSHHIHQQKSKNTPIPSDSIASNEKSSSGCLDSLNMRSSCTSDSSSASHFNHSVTTSDNCAESQSRDLPSTFERRVYSYRKQRKLRLRSVSNPETLPKSSQGDLFSPSYQTQNPEDNNANKDNNGNEDNSAKIAIKIDVSHTQSIEVSREVNHPSTVIDDKASCEDSISSNDKTSSGCVDSLNMPSSCTSDSRSASHIDPSVMISDNCAESQSRDLPSSLGRRVYSYRKQRKLRLRSASNPETIPKSSGGTAFSPSCQTQKPEDNSAKRAIKIYSKTGVSHKRSSDASHECNNPSMASGANASPEENYSPQYTSDLDNAHTLQVETEVSPTLNISQTSSHKSHVPEISPNKHLVEPLRDISNNLLLEDIIEISKSRNLPSSLERLVYCYTKQNELRMTNRNVSNPETFPKTSEDNACSPSAQTQKPEESCKTDISYVQNSNVTPTGQPTLTAGNNVALEENFRSQSAHDLGNAHIRM